MCAAGWQISNPARVQEKATKTNVLDFWDFVGRAVYAEVQRSEVSDPIEENLMSDNSNINLGSGAPGAQKLGSEFSATSSTNAWVAETARKATNSVKSIPARNFKVAFLLSIFFGFVGADRFYLGNSSSALLKLVTAGGFYIWWIYDFIQLGRGVATDKEGRVITLEESDKALVRIMKWVGLVIGVLFVFGLVTVVIQAVASS